MHTPRPQPTNTTQIQAPFSTCDRHPPHAVVAVYVCVRGGGGGGMPLPFFSYQFHYAWPDLCDRTTTPQRIVRGKLARLHTERARRLGPVVRVLQR